MRYFKRWVDVTVAFFVLLLSLPVWLPTALLLYIFNRGEVLFRQQRPGQFGKPFTINKFKTMTDATDEHGNLLSDSDRLTWIGKLVRKTSLDELPQLWNVLKGDISLIGPRPLLMEYLPLYSPEQARRHLVKPGITGWAQVHGRNRVPWPQRFAYDVWYVEHQSFKLDLKILLLTLRQLFRHKDVNAPGSATMEKFRGNPPALKQNKHP
ncbi:MAG: sugar transferase [Hymenobacteraceae bacterium]|nr:sugar transferase [Hymenobacteraceae bacterium]MDX5397732.1 sugar transferase [Hymenobacteraceae bacterium]MDX5513810.1 sugar transferase [Hymenobacteraceae bacterium]